MAVYFARSKQSGDVKIGYTGTSVVGRLKALQTGNPDELEVHLIVDGGPKEEAKLHEEFAGDRIRGEWFRYSDDIDFFVRRQRLNNTELLIRSDRDKYYLFEAQSKTDIDSSVLKGIDFEDLIFHLQDRFGHACHDSVNKRAEKWAEELLHFYLKRKITGDQYEALSYRMKEAKLRGENYVCHLLAEAENIGDYCIKHSAYLESQQVPQKTLDEWNS